VDQPLRFLGQYFDSETGLHYNRARYYDPALGCYLSLDPALPAGSANLYRYVAGNPINLTDPLGLFGESWPGWVKTTVSVAASVAVVGLAVLALPAELPILAAVAATVAVGALAGAAGFGVSAAMTKGGCVWCGIKEGAVIGAIGALPFVAAIVLAGPAAIGVGVMAGIGGASGALSYTSDWLLYDHPWSTTDFLITVGVSAATAGIMKYAGGKIAARRGGAPEAGAGDTSTTPDTAAQNGKADATNSGDRDTVPTIKEPPPKPPSDVPSPKTGDPYADRATEMTDYGRRFDGRHRVQTYRPEELEAHRVVPTDDGRLVYAQSGEPVNGDNIYVMDKSGNVYADKPDIGNIHHSTLAGGEDPAGAGHLYADNGRLLSVDDSSGHYGENLKPDSPEVVKNELASQGADVSQTQTSSHGDPGPNPPLPPLPPVDPGPALPPELPGPRRVPVPPAGTQVPWDDDPSGTN
jgi:RHS repeat-associated protein